MPTPHQEPTLDGFATFIARYAANLLACGATCIRLEKNLARIARAYGYKVETTILPRHIHLTVWQHGRDTHHTIIQAVPPRPISFNVNAQLSQLSWDIADHKTSFAQATAHYIHILDGDSQNLWLLIPLVAVANASFCRLFGGDAIAMAVVAVATLAGFYLKTILQRIHTDPRVIIMACALVSSILGATALLFNLGTTPQIALGTSVLYLVPGIPILNSFSDLIYRHYICAFSRFIDAMTLTACLSIGLFAGMTFMQVPMFN